MRTTTKRLGKLGSREELSKISKVGDGITDGITKVGRQLSSTSQGISTKLTKTEMSKMTREISRASSRMRLKTKLRGVRLVRKTSQRLKKGNWPVISTEKVEDVGVEGKRSDEKRRDSGKVF